MSQDQTPYSSLDPRRLANRGEFSFLPTSREKTNNQVHHRNYEDEDNKLQGKLNHINHQKNEGPVYYEEQQQQVPPSEQDYYEGEDDVYQQYEDEDSYERQKQEIIDDLQNQSIADENYTEQRSEEASLYTLDDTPGNQANQQGVIYDLPTHISSHHDVLRDGVLTQPATPVSEPFQNLPPQRLRPLSQTDLASQIAEEELHGPLSSLAARHPATREDAEDWEERGAAKIVQKKTNLETGEEEEIIIRRSVRDFKFGKNIGFGSYSTVVLATDKNTNKNFAVKVLDKRHIIKEKKVKYVNIEKNTLNRLGARNGIVRLFFTFQDEASLYFVLDYAANGELLNLIKQYGSLTEETTRYYAAQILDAIKYMHDNGVIHRDLKPENILLDDQMRIQITDFGTAKLLEKNPEIGAYPLDTRAKSFVGTAEYVSPELLNEKAIGKSCDVWAFGCIVYQMIAGKPPFKATNEYLTFQKIIKLQYAFTAGFPMVVRDLIKRILVLNPANRLSVKYCMKHLFFHGIDFTDPDQVWGPEPPEVKGPYKINAKSMLPVPELSGNSMPKTRINLPRRVTPTSSKRKSTDQGAASTVTPAGTSSTTPVPNKPFTASQQVLQKAREKVAARKAQQEEDRLSQVQDQQQNIVKATSAASIALNRQPGEIIKQVNEQKELKRSAELQEETISLPSRNISSASTGASRTKKAATLLQPSGASTFNPPTPPMNPIDIKYSHQLRLSAGERVLHDGNVTLYQTTVDVLARKYKGKLKDVTNSGNTLLSQVANGSYRGLRNMDRYGEEAEKNIIAEFDTGEFGAPSLSDDEFFRESRAFKIKKFFHYGQNSNGSSNEQSKYSEEEEGDGVRDRVLVVTNQGRLLFLQRFKNDKDELSLGLRVEISLNHPMVKVREFIASAENLSPSQNSMKSFFVVEAYQRAFVIECYKSDVTKWCRVISESKALVEDKNSQPSSTQDPVTGLGINTVGSSSTAGIPPRKPSGNGRTASQSSIKRSITQPLIKSPKIYASSTKPPVIPQPSQPSQPSQPRLFHGLPLPKSTKTPPSSSSSEAAVTQANILTKAAKLAIASHPQSSSSHEASPGQINTGNGDKRPQVTGMNSRMLARSLASQRKR